MLRYIFISSLLAISLSASAQTKKQAQVVEQPPVAIDPPAPREVVQQPPSPDVFVFVEEMPSFPGDTLNKYISLNTRYPEAAQKEGIEGRVYVKMIISKDGAVDKPEVIRSSGNELLDAEALRVVRSMPKWKPGKQNGKPVNVYYSIPILFKLQYSIKYKKQPR